MSRKGENDASGQNVDNDSGPASIGFSFNGSKFLHELILAVFAESSTHSSVAEAHESLRIARISLAAKIISQPMLSLASRDFLRDKLRAWQEGERSRPVRLQIEKALQVDQAFDTK